MSSTLYTYEYFVDQIPHTDEFSRQRSKPRLSIFDGEIRAWVQRVCDSHIPPVLIDADKPLFYLRKACNRENGFSLVGHEVSQDVMTAFALWRAGYIKISTVVNRARHIGEEGITHNKKLFDGVYKRITLDLFTDEDCSLQDFVIKL